MAVECRYYTTETQSHDVRAEGATAESFEKCAHDVIA
jgi:hypothetical protein